MRNTFFLAFGILLLVVQSNLFRVMGRVPLAGVTPNLILPLVIFVGVHVRGEHHDAGATAGDFTLAQGAAISFLLGYFFDLFAGAPVGLFTFITVATFVVSRAAGVRLAAQTWLTKIALSFVFGVVSGVLVIVFTAIFAGDAVRPRGLAFLVLPHATSTALFSPIVFRLAEWIHQTTIRFATASEGGTR